MDKEKIKLSDGQIYDIDDILYRRNLFTIEFDKDVDIDGLVNDPSIFNEITILTRNSEECGKYEGYNTVYKLDGNVVILSNDESVYVEPPENNNTVEEPEYIEYIPTLEEIKFSKISELSNICNDEIEKGVDLEINGEIESFSYKLEDQNNIKDAFDLALQTGMDIPYHCNGSSIKIYTAQQIIDLYVAQKMNLTRNTSYFNQLKMTVLSMDNKDEIDSIKYGDELTGEYLKNYNEAIEHEQNALNALIEQRGEK